MPRRMFYNPATGGYEYYDEGDTSTVPDLAAVGTAIGATPPGGSTPPPAPGSVGDFGDYDPNYETTSSNLTYAKNKAENDYTSGVNQLNAYYQPQYGQLQQQHSDDLNNWMAQAAQQGILRSSNNLAKQGQIDSSFQNLIGGLTQAQQQGQENLSNQHLSALNDIAQQLAVANRSHADFLQQAAQQRAAQQADTEAAQGALNTQTQQNNDLLNSLGISPTGQISITRDPEPNVNIIPPLGGGGGGGAMPEWQQRGFGSQEQLDQTRDPAWLGNRLLQDWTQNLDMVDQNPTVMEGARNAFNVAGQNNPELASILGGPTFEAIRRRLGL